MISLSIIVRKDAKSMGTVKWDAGILTFSDDFNPLVKGDIMNYANKGFAVWNTDPKTNFKYQQNININSPEFLPEIAKDWTNQFGKFLLLKIDRQ